MSDLESKRDQFSSQLDRIAGRATTSQDPELALREWESGLEQRLLEFKESRYRNIDSLVESPPSDRTIHPPQPTTRPATPRYYSRTGATLASWFQDTDRMMMEELELNRFPPPTGFQQGLTILNSDRDMKRAIIQACGLQDIPNGVNWKDYHLAVFHIPGKGTLLNQSHYTKAFGVENLNDQNPKVLAKVISDVAMERWGWGYLLEYTTLGRQAGAVGLWPAMLAYRSRVPIEDQQALEIAGAIYRSWMLLKNGWQDWVWQYVMFKSHTPVSEKLVDRPRPGRIFELLARIQALFPMRVYLGGISLRVRSLLDLVKFVFLEQTEITPKAENMIVKTMGNLSFEYDPAISNKFGDSLSRIFGRLYFAALENKVGILSVPYAVLIASHLNFQDNNILTDAETYMNFTEADPRNNPNARLAMLSKIDSRVKYDPQAMFTAAWERLKLDGPREYFPR